ncbi:MAG: amidohydrolase family protein, partial [Phycisphaerales bacterium]|nr:amidohydrolase family protein [Phycisphaerales bacterium]
MIIDLHTHIWSSVDQLGPEVAERIRNQQAERWGQYDASPGAHERAMDRVDGSAVLGFRSQLLGANIPNELVADYVSRKPDRRFGIAGIDPMADDAMDQFDAALNLGLLGVNVSPACQGFHPSHSRAIRVYERCMDAGLPIFVGMDHPLTKNARLEFARPVLWDDVARDFPDLRVVITQLGHPWIDETLLLLSKHRSLFADLSGVVSRPWQLYNALLTASSFGVMDKLLFGSGFPRELPT